MKEDNTGFELARGTLSVNLPDMEKLESFELKDDGTIEVVSKARKAIDTWPQSPETAIKRIYKAKDGKIVLAEEIRGKVIPAQTTPERIDWEN